MDTFDEWYAEQERQWIAAGLPITLDDETSLAVIMAVAFRNTHLPAKVA